MPLMLMAGTVLVVNVLGAICCVLRRAKMSDDHTDDELARARSSLTAARVIATAAIVLLSGAVWLNGGLIRAARIMLGYG